MKALVSKIKRFYNQLKGLLPEALPVGLAAFYDYVDSLMATYVLPTNSRDDVIFTIAAELMHNKGGSTRASKYHFVRVIRAAAARQVAGAALYEVKTRHDNARRQAEASAQLQVSGSVAAAGQSINPGGSQ